MNSITQEAHFRQRVLKYSFKKGVSEAARRYHISRKTIYVWRKRYDGTWKSLVERSHRPHHHPNEHTAEEKEMILRRYPRYKNDLIRLWDSLRKSGYTRSYTSMLRVIRKWVKPEIKKRSARKNQPYQRAEYPGQKVQIDVKYVPTRCVTNGKKYYQYTAIDECTRFCYRELYEEHSTYSSKKFLNNLLKVFPFPIREIQTDNGSEWTTALRSKDQQSRTLFEQGMEWHDIIYHRIRIATPRHNGKVERQHRADERRFYSKMRMYSLEDGREQLRRYNQLSNSIPKVCLRYKSPNEVLAEYLAVM
jgi:transposase-like protein